MLMKLSRTLWGPPEYESFPCFQFLVDRKQASFTLLETSVGKESPCNSGDPSSNPESGRSAGEGIGYPLQYSWASLVENYSPSIIYLGGDLGSVPGLGRSPGEGKSYPFQYSGLESSMGWKELAVTKLLSLFTVSFPPFLTVPEIQIQIQTTATQGWEGMQK